MSQNVGTASDKATDPMAQDSAPKRTAFRLFGSRSSRDAPAKERGQDEKDRGRQPSDPKPAKWTWGILADSQTDEVPGTVLLLSKYSTRNIPLGLQHERTGRSGSRGSMPREMERRRSQSQTYTKKTADGKVILDPQPDDSANDPLNWPAWRRDMALLSLGFYCMVGGGMTPILAAGFNNVAAALHTTYARVALSTGLYMLGLGVGSVIFSPTAILLGKRPVYLFSAVLFVLSAVWCALAPTYAQLVIARVFQGIAVSPVECLPSATIAEIYFLHERAFRIGVYTLLLLGGKNLVPLVSAAIIQALSWRWVFWIVAIVVGFGGSLLFFFVPETFWDRTPRPRALSRRSESRLRRSLSRTPRTPKAESVPASPFFSKDVGGSKSPSQSPEDRQKHATTADPARGKRSFVDVPLDGTNDETSQAPRGLRLTDLPQLFMSATRHAVQGRHAHFAKDEPNLPTLHNFNSPYYVDLEQRNSYITSNSITHPTTTDETVGDAMGALPATPQPDVERPELGLDTQSTRSTSPSQYRLRHVATTMSYTTGLRKAPAKSYLNTLKPWNGRLGRGNWFKIAIRPFILYAYPAVLWSSLVYSLSIGWLIVLSESVSNIYKNRASYNFSSLGVGLVYMSPFIGGIIGTAVAGKVSDIIVRFMARLNGGVYEPEYRLVMAVPIMISTAIGLMGFGWSAEERDAWIVPTIFFGVISFGCSLGSTTSITFCVDSYRQYAGEALVTLNFSKNIFHGLVWSLFFPNWLESDGPKKVFLAIGGIQIACLLTTIPMYIFGKRARMWTVRRNMMERL